MHTNAYRAIEDAAKILSAGGLVALPTETVYGLAANAFDPLAVAKIFQAKDRPFFDPLIVHLADAEWWPRVVTEFPPLAKRLADRFWPGPLTMVLPKKDSIPGIVTSGLPHVAIRVPDHELTLKVIRLANTPIAAPSANPFGRLSPTTAEHVRQQLGNRIDLILDGGPCRVGVESTILKIDGDSVIQLRPGGTPLEEIEALIGHVGQIELDCSEKPAAPGMLDSHYSPRTPLILHSSVPTVPNGARLGLLTLQQHGFNDGKGYAAVEVLSEEGDLTTAAANFFQALHRLDAAGLDAIFAVRFPEHGLGLALNDRLNRAAFRKPQHLEPNKSTP